MNRPGINISMFGVFYDRFNSFRRLRFNVSSKRLARIMIEATTWFPRQVAHLSFISIIVTNLPAFLAHATISR